ncbi:MAG TPA: RNA polymerase sigma factor [Planctomycetota bacterium]
MSIGATEGFSDEQLAQQARAGESHAFAELVKRHQSPVFSLLLRLVRNRDDALELAQDTFLKAFKHLAQYDAKQPFRTWLVTIAMNTAFNHLDARRLRRTAALRADAEVTTEAHSPLAVASRRELLGRMEECLQRVSEKARVVFMLRYQQGLSCDEISRLLGESLSNVKILLMRTRERLREELAVQ